jgi:hypothetical protein
MKFFPRHIDEKAPPVVIADSAFHSARAGGITSEPCFAASRGQQEQTVAHLRRNIGFDMIDEPAKSPREGA